MKLEASLSKRDSRSAFMHRYFKQKRIEYRVGLISAVTTIPRAFTGAYLTSFISSTMLGIILALFLAFVALRMLLNFSFTGPRTFKTLSLWHCKLVDSEGNVFEPGRP